MIVYYDNSISSSVIEISGANPDALAKFIREIRAEKFDPKKK